MPKLRGKVWRYGDDINTDYIFPSFINIKLDLLPWEEQWKRMGRGAMEGTPPELGDSNFGKKAEKGSFIVAGKNFGSGSSREEAAIAVKAAGTGAVLAESFARIWYRNAINNGLLALEVKDISRKVSHGDELEIDTEEGKVTNLTTGETIEIKPVPRFIMEILEKGGRIPMLKERLRKKVSSN